MALVSIVGTNCERDDICSETTPTTPRIIIEFRDATDTDELKIVPRLTVYGDSTSIPVPDAEDSSSAIIIDSNDGVERRLFNQNVSEAKPPLIVGAEFETITTRFAFERRTDLRLDEDPNTSSNVDIVEFTYVSEYVYVSRACGYKSIFTSLRVNVIDDGDNWIINTNFPDNDNTDNITVENEDTVHLTIIH